MFTGIVEELGAVETLDERGSSARLRLRCRKVLEDLIPGASVAINGVCLTAVEIHGSGFSAEVSPETLRRSNLGELRPGAPVNLERALSPSSRMGGHIVQGHIDTTGELVSIESVGDGNWWLSVQFPPEVSRYIVFKGSIAVDGISLTVASLEGDRFSAAVLPFTYQNTVLSKHRRGARVNLECDILAKYVEKMLGALREQPASRLSVEKLKDLGF